MKEFWKAKSLQQLSEAEWESLCDGCARCCMVKLQDEDTDEVVYTSIVCDLLDQQRCRCTRYPQRHELVADCVELSVEKIAEFHWLPKSCAYRTIAEGRDLAWWHPLVSGDAETVFTAGIAVRGKVMAEADVPLGHEEDMIVHWVEM
ncbi:MAG: YcgN family cysteine cluster protein [Gammaproteobacteria bacterium TMED92]|nr:MAG: YcgN family cysteine cluster protein [Gammaproteobacteria bacterium TMED92]